MNHLPIADLVKRAGRTLLAASLVLGNALAAGPTAARPTSVNPKIANKPLKATPEPALPVKGTLAGTAPRVAAPKRVDVKQPLNLSEGGKAPLPMVQPPGAVQPMAPGHKPAAPLPELTLKPAIPELKKAEYASNGFIEVAGDILLVPNGAATLERVLTLARQAVDRTFEARPSLSEVDVSVYAADGYGGFGGPLPLFTASVPRDHLNSFNLLAPAAAGIYDRAWVNPTAYPSVVQPQPPTVNPAEVGGNATITVRPPDPTQAGAPNAKPLHGREKAPTMYGSPAEVTGEQVKQLAAQEYGSPRRGVLFHGDPTSGMAALSFDDAPHPIYEPLLLDMLKRNNIRATFFCIGRNAQAYPYFVRDMKNAGMEIGNHTYHHVRLPTLSETEIRAELQDANKAIEAITGEPVRYFRPPGGDYSPTVLRIANELGLTTAFWTDDPGDFNNPGTGLIESRLNSHLRAGGIVLLHDNVLETITVLPAFLRIAAAHGVSLNTLGTLAGIGRY